MPLPTMQAILDSLGSWLDDFDAIARAAHARYRSYDPAVIVEHDVRAQAACTYAHMLAEADRRISAAPGVRPLDVRGQKLWLFEAADVVIRFKKMDEDGKSRNYPTKQAKDFDAGLELPGLPMPPVRLTAGYLLDATGVVYVRTQVSMPAGKDVMWCAAVVPGSLRAKGQPAWTDVTRQGRL